MEELNAFEVKLIDAYVKLIHANMRKLESVPEKLRPYVAERLEAE